MTETTEEIRRLLDEAAAGLRASGQALTPEMVAEMTEQVFEQLGEPIMRDDFDRHRQAVYTYLDHLEQDNTMAAVFALKDTDSAGVIAILGSLINFWGEMLRGPEDTRENLSLGAMAKYTFDSVDRHENCTPGNCEHAEDEDA